MNKQELIYLSLITVTLQLVHQKECKQCLDELSQLRLQGLCKIKKDFEKKKRKQMLFLTIVISKFNVTFVK